MYYNDSNNHTATNDTKVKEDTVILVTRASSGNSFMMELIIEKLREKYAPIVQFFIFSKKEFEDRYSNWQYVKKTPVIFVLRNNKIQHQFEGLTSIEKLEDVLCKNRPISSS